MECVSDKSLFRSIWRVIIPKLPLSLHLFVPVIRICWNRYNLFNLVEHCHNRGLYRSIFLSIMEGEESFEKFSPGVRLKEPSVRKAASLLPHIVLFHGSHDHSIPPEARLDEMRSSQDNTCLVTLNHLLFFPFVAKHLQKLFEVLKLKPN